MSSEDEETERNISELALVKLRELAARHHEADPSGLVFTIEPNDIEVFSKLPAGLVRNEEGSWSFVSNAIRDKAAAEYHFDELKKTLPLDSPEWLMAAYKIWLKEGAKNDDTVAGRVLDLLSREVDLLASAARAIKNSNVFDVLFVVGAALRFMPTFNGESLCKLVRAQDAHTQGDLFRGAFFNKLADEISQRAELCRELLDYVTPILDEVTHRVYQAAVVGLAAQEPLEAGDRLIQDWTSPNKFLRSGVLKAIGSLMHGGRINLAQKDALVSIIRNGLESKDQFLEDAATEAIVIASSATCELEPDLEKLAKEGSRSAIVSLSLIYSRHWKERDRPERLAEVLSLLVGLLSNGSLNCTYIDDLFTELLRDPSYQSLVLRLLDQWVLDSENSCGPSVVECLKGTFSAILLDSTLLNAVVTRWLTHSEVAFPLQVDELLDSLRGNEFDPNARVCLDLNLIADVEDQLFELSMYSLSSFVHNGSHQISIVLSLLDMPASEYNRLPLVQDVLISDIGYEFPGLVIQQLEKILENGGSSEITVLCQTVISAIKTETDKRLNLPEKIELEADTFTLEALRRSSNDRFNREFKKQESKSIMSLFATTVPVKAGTQFFTYSGGSIGSPSAMGVIETKQFVPRRMLLDPVGMEMRRLTFIQLRKMLI